MGLMGYERIFFKYGATSATKTLGLFLYAAFKPSFAATL
jgi:hypothetical protein